MSTFNFAQFESTNSESNFKEQFTVEEVKQACGGADFRVLPSKDKATCFFACGRVRGYVAKATADKLKAGQSVGTLVVSHVVSENFNGLMLHEQATNNAIAVW